MYETTLSLFRLCVYLYVRVHHSIRVCVCVCVCVPSGQSCHASHTCSCHIQRTLLFVDKGDISSRAALCSSRALFLSTLLPESLSSQSDPWNAILARSSSVTLFGLKSCPIRAAPPNAISARSGSHCPILSEYPQSPQRSCLSTYCLLFSR